MSAHPGTVPARPAPSSSAPDRDAGTDARAVARDVLVRPLAQTSLLDAVKDLRRDVDATTFPLDIAGVDAARASRARLVDQLGEHLVPRLTELSAPAVVVVSGSTGAGKSTLVNSIVGREVTAAGVLRPTTRRPVLVHHPLDVDLISHHPVLESVEVAQDEAVPRGIALLDAPDLDSVLDSNRESAHRLLEAADLWLFVTTAARYGDALPWQVLEAAVERGTSIAMVLNRVPEGSLPAVRGDLLARLREHGLAGSPLFVVPDVGPHSGPLDAPLVAPVARWLAMLAGPDRARTVVGRTLRGALAALRPWVDELADAVQAQADAAAHVGRVLDEAAALPVADAEVAIRAGTVADGAVRARWAELTAAGAPLARLTDRRGRAKGGPRHARARTVAVVPLLADLVDSAAAVLASAGEHAEDLLRAALDGPTAPPGGADVLAAWPARVSGRTTAAERAARAWTAEGARAVRALLAAADQGAELESDRVRAAARAVGADALAAVALTAAAGVPGAADDLAALIGTHAEPLVEHLRDDLADRARDQVGLERDAAGSTLSDPDLAEDASSRLRLRLAVLKGLT